MVVGVVGIGAWFLVGFSRIDLNVPMNYEHDAFEYAMVSQTVNQTGGYMTNDHLGAPFGQDLHDFPYGADNLNIAALRVLNGITGNPGLSLNLLYFLGYPLAALGSFLALRRLKVSAGISCVAAILISFAPYHQSRAVGHLFLSSYYMVPFGVLLVILACASDAPLVGWRARRDVPVLLGCAALASTGAYYALFTVLLLGIVGLASAFGRRSLRPLKSAVFMSVAIVGVLAINLAPSLVWRATHSDNPSVAARWPIETELYGLKITAMLMPIPNHRVPPLAHVGAKYLKYTPLPSEGGQQIGLVAVAGLALLLASAIATLFRRRTDGVAETAQLPGVKGSRGAEWEALRGLVLGAILLSTVGGFSFLLSAGGLSELRGWNRMSIVIMTACIFAVAMALEHVRTRLSRGLFGVALAVIALVGVVDQVGVLPADFHTVAEQEFRSDRQFFHDVSRGLGGAGAVLQLPYVSYPETPTVYGTGAFDPVAGFLHAPELRWSFGGMRGRVPGWQERLNVATPLDVAHQGAAMNFDAIVVDHRGFADGGAALTAGLLGAGLTPGRVSADGRYQWFDLRPARKSFVDHGIDLDAIRRTLYAVPPTAVLPHRQVVDDPNSPVITG